MQIIEHIQNNYDLFTTNEKAIAQYIIKEPKDFARLNINDIVTRIGVSKAALIRFSKKLGFNGYTEFKYELNRSLLANNPTTDDFEQNNIISGITQRYIHSITEMESMIDEETLKNASKALTQSNRIRIFGFNKTGHSVLQLHKRLFNTGVNAQPIVDDMVLMSDAIASTKENDSIIIISTADRTSFFTKHITEIQETGCNIILITLTKNLPISKNCDFVFTLPMSLKQYGRFIDEQALIYIFIEILMTQIAETLER